MGHREIQRAAGSWQKSEVRAKADLQLLTSVIDDLDDFHDLTN